MMVILNNKDSWKRNVILVQVSFWVNDILIVRVKRVFCQMITLPRVSRCARGNARESPAESGGSVLRRDLHRDALASLPTTTAKCFAAPLRLHAGTEAVLADTTRIAGTICGLAHGDSRSAIRCRKR